MLKSLFPSRPSELPTATSSSCHPQQPVQEIFSILKSERENLKAGRCRLKLTGRDIQELCSTVYSSKLLESPSLSDLLLCVKALRIVPESENHFGDPDKVINLSPFHNLTHLQVSYVNVTQLTNLSKLRSQLNHLVLSGCIDSLDTILLECGGDKCLDSFLWSELQSLYVTNCPNLDLGKSLQLAPWLKTLDLSSNCLGDNGIKSLSSLLTIHKLILSFNCILKVPSLAPSARTTLKVLHVRQNQLDSIRGIEQLVSLQELDLAYNCIANGEALSALCSLPHLVKLCLESNPISYSKDYRLTVVRRLSTAVNKKKFFLDGQALSLAEKDSLGTMATLYLGQSELVESWRRQPVQINVHEASTIEEPERVAELPSTPLNSGLRTPVNQSPTGGLLNSPASGSTSKLTLSAAKKRKSSRMREVEIVEVSLEQPSTPEPARAPEEAAGSDALHLTTKQRLEELRQTFGEENWLHSQAGNQVRQLLGWQESEATPPIISPDPADLDIKRLQVDASVVTDDAIIVLTSESEARPMLVTDEVANEEDETADLNVFVVQRQIKDELYVERLFTVSTVFFHEKDSLNGQTISRWRRSSLQRVLLLEEPSITHPKARIQFSFHPVSRNGDEPIYLVDEDDFNEMKSIGAITKTNLESTSPGGLSAQVTDQMSCMKCDKRFPALRAAVKLRKITSSPILKGQLEEYPVCPFCGSDMVFAINQPEIKTADASSTTSSSSNHSGSDVVVALNEPYNPRNDHGGSSDDSEEGSVEVMEKKMHAAPSSPVNSGSMSTPSKKGKKSSSSVSESSKNGSHASRANRLGSSSFSFSYADFSQVDHRLRLFCDMSLLTHQSEEFYGLIRAEFVSADAGPMDVDLAPASTLVVVTSLKVYVLRITGSLTDQPEKWLTMEHSFNLNQLTKLVAIIGYQGLLFHFGTLAPLLLMLRDQKRTKNVAHFFISCLEKSGLPKPSTENNLMASQWLAMDGLVTGEQDNVSMGSVEGADLLTRSSLAGNNRVFLFCLTCRVGWETSRDQKHSGDYPNAALMITSDRIALLRGDLRWLLSPQVEFRTWGVSILSLHQIVNLVSLESFVSKPEQLRFYFLDEASDLKEQWTVTVTTREAVDQLIETVRYPWEAMFSVELEINELDE